MKMLLPTSQNVGKNFATRTAAPDSAKLLDGILCTDQLSVLLVELDLNSDASIAKPQTLDAHPELWAATRVRAACEAFLSYRQRWLPHGEPILSHSFLVSDSRCIHSA